MSRLFRLVHQDARQRAAAFVLRDAADGCEVLIREPRKSRPQEEKYHAMFDDIARQVPVHGVTLDAESMKRVLVSAFKVDTKDDPELAEFWREVAEIPMTVGFRGEIVIFGDQTRRFPKKLASALVEWLYAFGAEHGVQWSEPKAAKVKGRTARELADPETGEITEEATA